MNTALILPARNGSEPLTLPDDNSPVVIIGANGAGKTRFTLQLIANTGNNAFTLSALNALFTSPGDMAVPDTIDSIFSQNDDSDNRFTTRLDSLLHTVMKDEMLNLLAYKLQRSENSALHLPVSTLDRIISLWQEIFPDNRVLIDTGKLLFSRNEQAQPYSPVRLSTGERAVLYYIAALSYAPHGSIVFVDNPDIFLHPTITESLWNKLELMRPDCRFIYTTHNIEFALSRSTAQTLWVRACNLEKGLWDYELLPKSTELPEQAYLSILGSRKPVLFIEGDASHSIDFKLYSLVFNNYTVKPMGSCNKVIEVTRSFNDLSVLHHLDSHGIVDRDRREQQEVEYLRRKKIFVPDVAEIENLLMLEDVVKTVASTHSRDEKASFGKVRHAVMRMFSEQLHEQALQHTRHRAKRFMETRADGRFTNITMLEQHLHDLSNQLDVKSIYNNHCRTFKHYLNTNDYTAVLRVFNHKSMLSGSNVAGICGAGNSKEEYINDILNILHNNGAAAQRIRNAVFKCFGI